MNVYIDKRMMDALGEANLSKAKVMTTPNHPVRFWIITMMLVLLGLATLKLW